MSHTDLKNYFLGHCFGAILIGLTMIIGYHDQWGILWLMAGIGNGFIIIKCDDYKNSK